MRKSWIKLLALAVYVHGCTPGAGDRSEPAPQARPSPAKAVTVKDTVSEEAVTGAGVQIPRGVSDTGTAYVAGPQGPIIAIDLASGSVLARSEFPATPVAVAAGAVIGWAAVPKERNRIRLFAASVKGDILHLDWETTLQLPAWVDTNSPEADAFVLEANVEADEVVVTWEAHARYGGGAPPPPDVAAAGRHDERRTQRFDRHSGTALGEERAAPAPIAQEKLPELPAERRIVSYRVGDSWATSAWQAGARDVFLATSAKEPGIVLVRGQAGDETGSDEVRLTADARATVSVTPDGRLVFVHDPAAGELSWQVYAAETGQRLAQLPYEAGTASVAVSGERVLYEVLEETGSTRKRVLRCRDLKTGQLQWSQVLKEEEVAKAPPPPMR